MVPPETTLTDSSKRQRIAYKLQYKQYNKLLILTFGASNAAMTKPRLPESWHH